MEKAKCSFCGPIQLMEGQDTCPNCGTKIVGNIKHSQEYTEDVESSHKPTWQPSSWNCNSKERVPVNA